MRKVIRHDSKLYCSISIIQYTQWLAGYILVIFYFSTCYPFSPSVFIYGNYAMYCSVPSCMVQHSDCTLYESRLAWCAAIILISTPKAWLYSIVSSSWTHLSTCILLCISNRTVPLSNQPQHSIKRWFISLVPGLTFDPFCFHTLSCVIFICETAR